MAKPLRLGVAGLGTVGGGLIELIRRNHTLLEQKCGRPIEVSAVCARTRSKQRDIDLSGIAWANTPTALAARPDVDIFVELIGGHCGAARDGIEAAIASGKDIVTANKALLALHGQELAEQAERCGCALKFEAAIAGGIPVVKALSEGLSGNHVSRVTGIMNGTCNYILTRMEDDGLDYQEVFDQARSLGYLEADPTLDVGGIDAGHKLALLAAIAFGTQPDFGQVRIEGIQSVSRDDIEQARDMGYRIKLLCVAVRNDRGIEQSTRPCLVPATSPIGQIGGATNIVVLEGDSCGAICMIGSGAGAGPTASAVIADILDIARGSRSSTFGQPATQLEKPSRARHEPPAPYYIRLCIIDKPGSLAKVATSLSDAGISINRMRQYRHEGEAAPVIIVTHATTPDQITDCREAIAATGVSLAEPVAFRIETG